MPKLVVFRGDAVENEVRLEGNTVRIGRNSGNDIVLDDSSNGVSRFHAEIRIEGGTYFIVDLKSRNGVWINGRRIKEKAALTLGVPVTVGSFELALEDDTSSGEFHLPVVDQHTVVNAPPGESNEAPSRTGTRSGPMRARLTTTRREVLMWSGVAAIVLLICAVTIVVVRRVTRPVPVKTAAKLDQPLPVSIEPPSPPPPSEEDLKKAQIEQSLSDARAQREARDYDNALASLNAVLELDPENTEAGEMKGQVEAAIAAAASRGRRPSQTGPKPPEAPTSEVETPGIARRPGEFWPEYMTRARRVTVAFLEGKSSLDKGEFAAALGHFRTAARDQPGYQGVEQLIAEALDKQKRALEEAMNSGQANEQAAKLKDARRWYLHALEIDPGSTSAREKNAALLTRMNADAQKLLRNASTAMKLQDPEQAIRLCQQVVDLMLPGDELRDQAQKQLEALKR